MARDYPSHIYEPIRIEIATSYIKHEFRKLLWRVPESHWEAIDRDISDWMNSPRLATPRDFWNGFHGISMGFKLIIGLVYLVTAENIDWKKKQFPISKLWFGVEQKETKVSKAGKLSVKEVIEFYSKEENKGLRDGYLKNISDYFKGVSFDEMFPIIIIQKQKKDSLTYVVHDGNRRLMRAVLGEEEKIPAYVGKYTTREKFPKNYWIPTSILMDNLFFARRAYNEGNKKLFDKYMSVLKDMLDESESAVYEMKNRAITKQQPFRNDVLEALSLL